MKHLHAVGLIVSVILSTGIEVYAGRPARIDDADPVAPGEYEFEAGINYIEKSDCRHWDYPFGLTYGLMSRVELACGFGGQFEEMKEDALHVHHKDGLCDLVMGTKVSIFSENTWIPRQALSGSVKIPTADDEKELGSGKTDYDLTWIASKSLNSGMSAHVNVGYVWIGKPDSSETGDLFHYGIGLDLQLMSSLQWIGEIYAEKELREGPATLWQCNTGIRWKATDRLLLDMAAGTKLHGEVPPITATAGLTWVFGGDN